MRKRNNRGQFIGGESYTLSKEHKRKISEAHKGKKFSEETKKKISKLKKGMVAWNKGLKGWTKGTKAGFQKGNKIWLGKHHTKETREKMKGRTNELSNSWKGDDVSERGVHKWLESNLGKAKEHKCILCGKQAYDWSNKNHTYKRILDDYQPMCRKCHMHWDKKHNNRKFTNQFLKAKI